MASRGGNARLKPRTPELHKLLSQGLRGPVEGGTREEDRQKDHGLGVG